MSIKFGKDKPIDWKKQVDQVFTVVVGYKDQGPYRLGKWTGDFLVTVSKGGKKQEEWEGSGEKQAKTILLNAYWTAISQGHIVSFTPAAKKVFTGKPTLWDVKVDVWEERDRLHIWVHYKDDHPFKPNKTIAEWWDDDARQMFEDGFFKGGHLGKGGRLEESVLMYCQELGLLQDRS